MMQLVLIVLAKRKERIRYCETSEYGGTMLSNIITNNLTYVSVPAEEGSIIPIMGISLNVLQLSTNNQIILYIEKKAHTSPNSSTKATNNQIIS
jgi:hypothetical protein